MKYLYFLFLLPVTFFAQVTVDINSGNPTFPFPQFLAYESDSHSLGNLATQNAPGVTHAEMEQTIRDAWQIMANRFVYQGISEGVETTYQGVKYIKGNLGCPYDCSEGDGYALLAAAEMADKTTFDGLWFRAHDYRMINQPRYSDCKIPDPNYRYGRYALKDNGDSAADGDFDIALALLVASKQWETSGITDACGDEINYKTEALKVIRGLVEKSEGDNIGDRFYASGSIGFDGYIKGGNTWNELTTWAADEAIANASIDGPQFAGQGVPDDGGDDDDDDSGEEIDPDAEGIVGTLQHIDYAAPAYFHAFAEFLEEEGNVDDLIWNIEQFKRGEASSDWLMGKMLDNPATLPLAGWVGLTADNEPKYFNFLDGEDFRNPWRTILNYVWHGNPSSSWNAETHQIENGSNSYEKEIGERLAKFLANTGDAPWDNECSTPGGGPALSYNGPSQLKQYYDPNTGKSLSTFPLNWLPGTGSPAAVAAQDFDLMGKLYRQCVIEWDTTAAGDGYLTSVPGYFHGFFRLLGMLTLSGNHQSPAEIELESNVKVYHELDKTFAFTGDELEYTISYRNYASVTATGVQISTTLPQGLSFVEASNGGINSGNTVSWSIGTVAGFNSTDGVSATTGQVTLKVQVDESFSGSLCNQFELTTTNGKGWISNEYPNGETAIMQRNCVDIVARALEIDKTVNYDEVNPGDVVTYKVDFENASSGGFINGGRPDVVVAYAHSGHEGIASFQNVKIRLYHGAVEPYIDYGNYRISLFVNENATNCVSGTEGCDDLGWSLDPLVYEGGDKEAVIINSEEIIPGSDERGSWNQRIIIKFSEQLATITPHISRYYGIEGGRVHLGGAEPLRAIWQMHADYKDLKWEDDWSWNPGANDSDGGLFYPVTNDWTDPNNPDLPVTVYHNEACETPMYTVDNILVEEWDGYTWRRAYGNSPVPGRETENVLVKDVLPEGFTFLSFVDDSGKDLGETIEVLGEPVVYDEVTRTITWFKSILQVKEVGSFSYKMRADFSSGTCTRANEEQINVVSIEAETESPKTAEASVIVTCEPVILPPAPSSMVKEVSSPSAAVGEQVIYTLSYKNTDAAAFQSDFTEEWTVREGQAMIVDNSGVSNLANNTHVFTNNFSHGTNGIIEATLEFADNAQFGFALRYDGDLNTTGIENGYYLVFKPNSGSGGVETTLYNGTTQVGETDTNSLTIPSSVVANIKIELDGEQVNVWMGNTSSPNPSLTFTGIEERAGYIGLINGAPNGQDNYAVHKLTSFYSAMDSAFNVQITDPIPGELSFVASAEGTNIDGVVTFPMLEGPVLAGAEIGYEWTAEIVSCPADLQKIDNVAYTNIFGIEPNSIAAQAILDCSGLDLCGETPPIPELLKGEEIVLCETIAGELNLEEYVIVTSADYELIWFDGPSKFDNEIDQPTIDASAESNTTYYVAQIEDVVCGEGDRVAITFSIGGSLEGFNEIGNLESGETLAYDLVALGLTSGSISWEATNNENVSGETLLSTTSDTLTDTLINETDTAQEVIYTVTEAVLDGCPRANSVITITVAPSIVVCDEILTPEVENVTLCLNDSGTIDLDDYVTTTGEILWYADDEPETVATSKPEVNTNVSVEITYFVSQKIDDCESARVPLELVILDALPVPIVENVNGSVCSFLGVDFSLDNYVETTGTLVWYASENATNTIVTPIINVKEALNTTYYVSQVIGSCESTRVPIEVLIEDTSAEAIVVTKEIDTNATVDFNISAELGINASDYVWSAQDNPSVTGESVIESLDGLINDTLINTTAISQDVVYTITPNACEKATYELVVTVTPLQSVEIFITSVTEGEDMEISLQFTNAIVSESKFVISFTPTTVNGVSVDDISLVDELITVPAGSVNYSFTRPTIDDTTFEENNEQVIVAVESVDTNEFSSIETSDIGTIFDNDGAPNIIISDVTLLEGDTAQITIELSHAAIDDVMLTLEFVNTTATAIDYEVTSQVVLFSAGNTLPDTPIIIEATDDNLVENDEVLEVRIAAVDSGSINDNSDTAQITIEDNDQLPPDVIITDLSLEEGETKEINIELSIPAIDDIMLTLRIENDTSSDDDYIISTQEVTFSTGNTLPDSPITIEAIVDNLVEGDEILQVSVSSIDAGSINKLSDTAEITIEDGTEEVTIPECAIITNPDSGETDVNLRPVISWGAVTGAEGYFISIGTSENGTDTVATQDVGNDTSFPILFDLEEGNDYYILVTSYNSAGSATGCDPQMFTTQEAVEVSKTKYGLSPDGDGINEVWLIDGIEDYPNNEVLIYNRWGNLVYRTINYDNSFNVFSGEANQQTNLGAGELLSGTYFYEIKIEGEHNLKDLRGFLVLKN